VREPSPPVTPYTGKVLVGSAPLPTLLEKAPKPATAASTARGARRVRR
jgi:hypothetical protein